MNISVKFGPNLFSGFREDENMFTDADDDDGRKVMTKAKKRKKREGKLKTKNKRLEPTESYIA